MLRIVLLVLLLTFAAAAQAQPWLDQPGVAGTTVAAIGDAKIRLPPGQWQQVSDNSFTVRGEAIPILERVYIQTDGGRVVALAYLRTNGAPARSRKGFLPNANCFRQDLFFSDSHDVYPGQWDCLIVSHATMRWDGEVPPFWQSALDAMAKAGGVPRPAVLAEMSKASPSRNGFAVMWIGVNPGVSGFKSTEDAAWSRSEWHQSNATPDRVAFLKKVAAWATAYRPIFAKSWE